MISKDVENQIFRLNWIFRGTFMSEQPTLTKYWNHHNIFVQIVISDTLVGSFLDALFLLLAVILLKSHEKPRRNTEKSAQKNLCENHHFFYRMFSFLCHFFVAFFLSTLPLPKWRTCLMFPLKIHNVAMGGILCDDIMSERSKIRKPFAV